MRKAAFKSSILTLTAIAPQILCMCPAKGDTYEFDSVREIAESPARKIDLRGKQPFASGEVVSKDAQPKWKPPEKSTLVVKTGPDSVSILGKDSWRIIDFKNKKIWSLSPEKKTYFVQSLYADLAFRQAELNNRMFLKAMVGNALKGKMPGQMFDAFYSEEMFGLRLPDKNSGYKLSKSKAPGSNAEDYKYDNTVVTSFTAGAAPLVGEKRRQFSRFLLYGTYLHPDIRIDIEKAGKVPQKLMYYLDNQPVAKQKTLLTLKKQYPGDYVASVPGDFSKDVDPRDPLNPVYARIKELGGTPAADLKQQTLDYYKKAVENKNYFDALLSLTEYGLQTGENLGEEMKNIRDQIKADSDCQKLLAGLASPQNEQQAKLELGSLDMIDRARSPRSYLIDIFRANLLINLSDHGIHDAQSSQESDPAKAFVKALKHNPFITGVYHDLGKYLESCYMHSYAWECYDLARRFYPQHPFLEEIAEREQELSRTFPQFISGDKIQ